MYKLWDTFYWILINYVLLRCGYNVKSVISKDMLQIKFMSTYGVALMWMPQDTFDDKSTSV